MKIVLNKRGAASKGAKALMKKMNNWMETKATAQDMQKYYKQYHSEDELRTAWNQMSADSVEPAKVEATSSEPFRKPEPAVEESTAEPEQDNYSNDTISEAEIEDFDLGGYDPNASETIEREYNKQEIDEFVTEEISEPTFSSSVNEAAAQESEAHQDTSHTASTGGGGGQDVPPTIGQPSHQNEPHAHRPTPPSPPPPVNPAMNELGDREKKIAAEQMVDLALELYGKAHEVAKPLLKVKVKKLNELEAKGEIDPTDTIPVNEAGDNMTARQLIMTTNEEIESVLTPDPTFNGKVRPAMVREFTKRGMGLSDMNFILVMFAQDIAMKTGVSFGLKKQYSEILNIYREKQAEKLEAQAEDETHIPNLEPDSISKSTAQEEEQTLDTEEVFEEVEEVHEVE